MTFKVGNSLVGSNQKVYIVAELSANHNHDFDCAKRTIKAMKESGADAVKFQTYTADTITAPFNNEYFQIKTGPWAGQTLYELYQKAYTPWEWIPDLKTYALGLGLDWLSSPFDKTAVDFLKSHDVHAYKVASFEITDTPLIQYMAEQGKPIIISTGIATSEEIIDAVNACRAVGNEAIILLKCTSAYPASIEEANLRMLPYLRDKYNVLVGISDHTMGSLVPTVSVGLGVVLIEKHFILDRTMGGPDAAFSLEPTEFKQMVNDVRLAEKALGGIIDGPQSNYSSNRQFCRSLFVVKNIAKGEVFTEENVRSIRPGYGLAPKYLVEVLGRKANVGISAGAPFSWDMAEGGCR